MKNIFNMVNHIVSDLVSRLKSGSKKRLVSIKVIYTKFSIDLLQILWRNGLIFSFRICDDGILVFLKYNRFADKPIFKKLEVISKPSKRVFFTLNHLSYKCRYNSFCGFYVISTPKGLFTSNDCLLGLNVCGEVILKVEV